ncbi:MAG: GatB/YqeY domain-containing protein [Desulfuromonadales bacterium]|jgi:uncharacterized protein YqeY|nr:GatB/YqeY domain-containing protein [Desulfuromonadales bacterium]
MTIQERLAEEMKSAMKAKEALRLSTIRMARTAIKNAEIEARQDIDDESVIKVLSTMVKQRREAAEAYRETRPELAEKEEQELAVLQEFLPQPLTPEEIQGIIDQAIEDLGASSMKDMGPVMKQVTARTVGRADGKQVSNLVRQRLSGK